MSVSADNVRSLYRNILGREPDPAGLANFQKAPSPAVVAAALDSSYERLSGWVRFAYGLWLGREPSPGEVTSWVANAQRLGYLEAELYIATSVESLGRMEQLDQKVIPTPIPMVSGKAFVWATMHRFWERDPVDDQEFARILNSCTRAPGNPPVLVQCFRMMYSAVEAANIRTKRAYVSLLGRQPVDAELPIWANLSKVRSIVPYIASAPEGLAYGLRKQI